MPPPLLEMGKDMYYKNAGILHEHGYYGNVGTPYGDAPGARRMEN